VIHLPHHVRRLGAAGLLTVLLGAGSAAPAGAAEPVPVATVTEATLPTLVHVGGPLIPLPVSVTLSEARSAVTLRLFNLGVTWRQQVIGMDPPGTDLSASLDPMPARGWLLGVYSWTVTPAGPSEIYSRPAVVRLHSLLGLRLERSGDDVTVGGSARLYNPNHDRYLVWPRRPIEVQRWTASGWSTIRTVGTDRNGNLSTLIRIPWSTGIRLHNPDSREIWGATTDQQVV
jgi:hypothetical protein